MAQEIDYPPALPRNPTRSVRIGTLSIGHDHPIVVQSMCATKTTDIESTVTQIDQLTAAGAGIVRLAVDTRDDMRALAEIRQQTDANLAVDLQENYRLAADVARLVEKVRYNPGHLYHFEPKRPWTEKVRFLAEMAAEHDCAMRVGVNSGSVDPAKREKYADDDTIRPMLDSALEHCEVLDRIGFTRYCVSLKDSDPAKVITLNRQFAAQRPDVPLHLGVTEAGMPPEGIVKTRFALERLIRDGIGDTLRVSLTLPFRDKHEEVEAGRQILADIAAGRFHDETDAVPRGLNIISCPSCSRVENEAFIELARKVKRATRDLVEYPITIAVMGCRVNGPGETDDADLGLWCGPSLVNLKRSGESLGAYSYEEILPRLQEELATMIARL